MLTCNDGCPITKENVCCANCEKYADCGARCESNPDTCGDSVTEDSQLAVFESQQLAALTEIAGVLRQAQELEAKEKKLRAGLLEAMESHGVKKFESDLLNLTYVAPTQATSVDSAKLKKSYPDVYAECSKTSERSAYVKITLK